MICCEFSARISHLEKLCLYLPLPEHAQFNAAEEMVTSHISCIPMSTGDADEDEYGEGEKVDVDAYVTDLCKRGAIAADAANSDFSNSFKT